MDRSELLEQYASGERDFSLCNLSGADLGGANLRKANLSEANLSYTNLYGANLYGANFYGANLSGANLSRADLCGAKFREADLREANLRKANLSHANFQEADLGGADLRKANLSEANLSYTNLSYANLSGVNLSGVNLSEAELIGTNLHKTNLSYTYLSEANLSEADLSEADLSEADLSNVNLSNVNLSEANLNGANLKGASLTNAKLNEANLRNSQIDSQTQWDRKWLLVWKILNQQLKNINLSNVNLRGVNLSRVNLSGVDLSGANLRRATLSKTNLKGANLKGADLSEANLSNANLSNANLSNANLKGADLSEANLSEAKLLNTSLKEAELTGACIEDWHTNNHTDLSGAFCDYIYLQLNGQAQDTKKRFTERRPHNHNKFFASGEFTKLFKKGFTTVDLIFSNGIDWKAFLTLFQRLQVECNSDELSINSFENKGDGTFVVRVNVPYSANKPEIEKYLKRQHQLESKNKQPISANKEQNANLLEIAKIMANAQPPAINVEAKAIVNRKPEQNNVNFRGASISGRMSQKNKGRMQCRDIHNYTPEQKQTLAEAAKEIQNLLKQLEQTNPTATEPEQIAYVNDETTPSLKRRAAKAFMAGGEAAIEEFLDNPYVNVGKAIVKGWIEA
ncbi:pentapeptide repeat-containing protein [Lusitaniella coriacea LEGE 07157]|uniref:Pentapeptide repeat-containing protein n=1 Tax=Lusitaniella coriacea LEGE 07157 TaxID=945747 RepID=A0A8J7DYJ6_9CYAN|nr:pentapeptide repeat-containing protein [Lusitaniella coriacea]MBE9116066.1 pentapeptide repeat-containing protein [Lusitaniella coriacea LEGE 07157]